MCDSLGLWLLSLLGFVLVVLGVVLWLYGRVYERLDTMSAFEDYVAHSRISAQGVEDDGKLYQSLRASKG